MNIYKCIELYKNNTEDPRLYRTKTSIEDMLELKELLRKDKKLYIDDIENRDNIEYSIVQDKLEFIEQHIQRISEDIQCYIAKSRINIIGYINNINIIDHIDSVNRAMEECFILT